MSFVNRRSVFYRHISIDSCTKTFYIFVLQFCTEQSKDYPFLLDTRQNIHWILLLLLFLLVLQYRLQRHACKTTVRVFHCHVSHMNSSNRYQNLHVSKTQLHHLNIKSQLFPLLKPTERADLHFTKYIWSRAQWRFSMDRSSSSRCSCRRQAQKCFWLLSPA